MMIGHCKVKLGPEFEDAIVKAVYENLPLPLATTIENDCKLTNLLGDQTGKMSVFVRLSCFGSTIVTEFQLLGEENEGYIFKTSKKDNTLEAQKKKGCFLFSKTPYKKETVVKSLNVHDISPLKPILATEEHASSITGEINNPYLSTPYKVVPWSKYVRGCGCEDLDDDISEADLPTPYGACGSRNQNQPPTYADQTQMCDIPPCPLPDCDCYNTAPNKYQNRSGLMSENKKLNEASNCCCLGDDGQTCTDCNGSSPNSKAINNNGNRKSTCPVDNCGCFPNTQTKSPQKMKSSLNKFPPSTQSYKNQSKNCPASDCECFNSQQRNDSIRKKLSPVCAPSNSLYSPYMTNSSKTGEINRKRFSNSQRNQSNENPRGSCQVGECGCYKNSQVQQSMDSRYVQSTGRKGTTENCFFTSGQTQQPQNLKYASNFGQTDSMKCKMGYNNRNECFCYGGGTKKPYTDTFGSPSGKKIPDIRDFKSGYETNSGGSMPVNVTVPEEIIPIPIIEDERLSHKFEEIVGAGGDSNWQDILTDPKNLAGEKGDEWYKEVEEKKPDDGQDLEREQEQEQVKKISSLEEKDNEKQRVKNGKQQMKKKKKFRSIFHYSAGMYPGINVGHRHCTKEFRFVPKTMGWLWNIENLGDNLKPRRGWRPGAINRTIHKMIRQGKLAAGLVVEEEAEEKKSAKSSKKVRRPFTPRSGGATSNLNSAEYSAVPQPPTLHLHKKDGAYFISMNPLKGESDDEEEERSPIMFKILPHEDEVSTSSESSLEIEFTAPGAFRKKPLKPVMETVDTQYSDPESLVEILAAPAQKGKKGANIKKGTESNPPSTMASVAKDNKWDADQPTQVGKTKK